MSLVFGVLMGQMAFLLLLLLPLPHVFRVRLLKGCDALQKSVNFKVGVIFVTMLLGLQFVDCLNKLKRYAHKENHFAAFNSTQVAGMTSDQLASKFFAQRNLYITGAVLYLEVAIATVVSILRKLVKKESEAREFSRALKEVKTDAEQADNYRDLIKLKERDIATFKKQLEGMQAAYDGLTESEPRSKDD